MANTFAPNGFQQYSGTGSAPTYEQVALGISGSNSTNPQIFYGDPVSQLSTGYICQLGTNSTTNTPAAGSGTIVGVFVGCKYLSTSQKRVTWSNYYPGNGDVASGTNVTAYVITDPNAQFIVQTGNGGPVTVAGIGQNIGVAYGTGTGTNLNSLGTTPGNVSNGLSTAYADYGTLSASTATGPFRVIGLANYSVDGNNPLSGINGNDSTTAYNRIVVAFNNVAMKSGTTGI